MIPVDVVDNAVTAGVILWFVWWRLDALEKKMDRTFTENAAEASKQRDAIKEFWTDRWPRVEVLEAEVHEIKENVRDVKATVGRLQTDFYKKGA